MSKHSKTVQNDLDSLLSALPDARFRHKKWTFQEDAALLKYVESKGITAVARAIKVERVTAKKRYEFLKAQQNGK